MHTGLGGRLFCRALSLWLEPEIPWEALSTGIRSEHRLCNPTSKTFFTFFLLSERMNPHELVTDMRTEYGLTLKKHVLEQVRSDDALEVSDSSLFSTGCAGGSQLLRIVRNRQFFISETRPET